MVVLDRIVARHRARDRWAAGLAGAGVAAGLMYWWDPRRGGRRRAWVRDKVVRAAHITGEALDRTRRDLAHRAKGLAAETRALVRRGPVDDSTLEERVRAALGRLSSHASALEVTSRHGAVRLDGPVLQSEWRRVVRGVARVRGVKSVEDRLVAHRKPGNVPALQGGTGFTHALLERDWAPAPRLVAGLAGATLAAFGLTRRGPLRAGLVAAGLTLAARSAANRLVGRWVGRRDRQALDIVKDMQVGAPVDRVFAFWETLENLPRFLHPLQEVRRLADGRAHWVAEGPAGRFEWDVEITRVLPGELIAWRATDRAPLGQAGTVHFEPDGRGGTRVEIRLRYDRPGDGNGRAFRKLLGEDPRQAVEDSLVRFKALIEQGPEGGAP
jgi:uncharacterized membrane protein